MIGCAAELTDRQTTPIRTEWTGRGGAALLTLPTTAPNIGAARLTTITTNQIDRAAQLAAPTRHLQVH